MTDDQLNKLPKWAQDEFRRLNMRLNESTKELNRINQNVESNTIVGWENPVDDKPVKYLEENQMITFRLPMGRITARITNYGLDINADASNDFVVKPCASNSVLLKFIK